MSTSKSKFCVSDVPPLLPGTTRHMQHQICDGNLTNLHPLKLIPVNNISGSFFPPNLHCNGIWFVLEFRFILKSLHSRFFNPLKKAYVESFVALSGFFGTPQSLLYLSSMFSSRCRFDFGAGLILSNVETILTYFQSSSKQTFYDFIRKAFRTWPSCFFVASFLTRFWSLFCMEIQSKWCARTHVLS